MRNLRFFVAAIVFCCGLFCGARAQAVTTAIAGQVLNSTSNDSAVANATVELLRVDAKGASQTLATAKTDTTGAFRTKSLKMAASDLVFARVDWQGYPYIVPAFDGAGRTGAPIDSTKLHIHVYDTTETAPRGMTFLAHHIALKDAGETLECTERIVVENPSNKTFIGLGKEGITLGLSLPKGAKNVALDPSIADAKLVVIGKKPIYAVSKPITPTQEGGASGNAIIVTYSLPWSKSVDLSRQLLYPEKFFFIVRTEADRDKIVVDAPQLGEDSVQPVPIDGQMQQRVVKSIGSPQSPQPVLAAGQQMEVRISRPTAPLIWAFIGLTALLCVFLPTAMLLNRRKPRRAPGDIEYSMSDSRGIKSAEPASKASVYSVQSGANSGIGSDAAPNEVARIVEKLAALDDDFEAGRIEENVYRTQRAQLKREVVAHMKNSG